MGFRTVYGNTISEDGWRMVDQDSCVWSTIPGTNVKIQTREGIATQIMLAFASQFNARIEPLRDADTGGWTLTNAVGTSNHLAGTAMDLNWESHPFHVAGTFGNKLPELRKLLDEFKGCIWWGGDWVDPIDEMHFQIGYPEGDQRLTDFAATLTPGLVPPTAPMSSSDRYAQAIIDEGQRRGITARGIQIALTTALVESGDPLQMWANSTVPESLNLPHDAVGSDHDSLGLFQQRCPMWGTADVLMDPTQSAGLFYDHLVKFDYNGSDSPGSYAQAVQVSAFPDRYDGKFDSAVQLYTRLTTTQSSGGVFMALTDAEQRELLELARQQSSYRRVSRSPLRHVGEGEIATATEFELNVDGNVHVLLVQRLAELGDPDSLNLLNEVANLDVARYPDRAHDRLLAQAILNSVAGRATVASAPPVGVTPGVVETSPVAPAPVQAAVAQLAPTETAPTGNGLFGELNTLRDQIHNISSTVNQITGGN
jgi:hypothetical protein